MLKLLKPAVLLFLFLTAICGGVYPLAVTAAAQALFPRQAEGSLIRDAGGRVVGSSLIGQAFADSKYFWSRPSATTPPYNGAASSGSNLGPTNAALLEAVSARVDALHRANPENTAAVPVDLVTASGSGLDPHISVAAAQYQITRVAKARGLAPETITALLAKHTTLPWFPGLGAPVVNVLALNLDMDAQGK